MDRNQAVGHVKKNIGQIFGHEGMHLPVNGDTFCLVKGAAPLDKQGVHFGVRIRTMIKFELSGFRRVPDVIQVRVLRQAPAHDEGVEFAFVDEFREQ